MKLLEELWYGNIEPTDFDTDALIFYAMGVEPI